MEPLTIESLARAIQVDGYDAIVKVIGEAPWLNAEKKERAPRNFDDLPEHYKAVRREQARLMYERIMR